MIGRLAVEPQPWAGRSSRRGQSRPSCPRQERETGQDCQWQTACAPPGRREREEAKAYSKESLFSTLKTEEHSSFHDIHRHLPGTEEVDPEVEAGIPGSPPHLRHHLQRAGLSCQPAAHSHSHNPLRPRQQAGGWAHPQRRQACQDQGEVADLHGDCNEDEV